MVNGRSMKKVLFFVVLVLAGIKIFASGGLVSSPSEQVNQYPGEVVLYATSWCGYCKKTRALLRDQQIAFTEYDIEKSERGAREFKALNGRGIPLVLIDGEVVRGYDPDRILKLAQAIQ